MVLQSMVPPFMSLKTKSTSPMMVGQLRNMTYCMYTCLLLEGRLVHLNPWNIPFTLYQSTLLRLWHLPCWHPSMRRSKWHWWRLITMANSISMNLMKLFPWLILRILGIKTMVMVVGTAMMMTMTIVILHQETHLERHLHLSSRYNIHYAL